MKRMLLVLAALMSFLGPAMAQEIRPIWETDFNMHFDNREFDAGGNEYIHSGTLFGARLTPSIGLAAGHDDGFSHKLMLGIDVFKHFGRNPVLPSQLADPSEAAISQLNADLFNEITLYYTLSKKFGKTDFSLTSGVFPRRMLKSEWSELFFSDSLKFYDPNLEGLLLSFDRPRSHYELGADWMGQPGVGRREKFMIFSAGKSHVAGIFSVGYSAYMIHYAGAGNVRGVVDNVLVEPYAEADFASFLPFQKLSLRAGAYWAYQHDRVISDLRTCMGGELTLELRKWNAGVMCTCFYGQDMMPFYNATDAIGVRYANNLYMGNSLYRVRADGSAPALYNRTEIYYEPYVGNKASIRCSALFHFNGSYSGCQQMVTVRFNLGPSL